MTTLRYTAEAARTSAIDYTMMLLDKGFEPSVKELMNRYPGLTAEDAEAVVTKRLSSRAVRLGADKGRHLYRMGVGFGYEVGSIDVIAHDRAHAERIAARAGYCVRDVNMIG